MIPGGQLVIYGANGWVGRSLIATVNRREFQTSFPRLLLLGSKTRLIEIDGRKYQIYGPGLAHERIERGAVFINSAFLRREFLRDMTVPEYTHRIEEISSLPLDILQKLELGCFINLSSGAAAQFERSVYDYEDTYGELKYKWEREFEKTCTKLGQIFLNCRIFNLSGRFLNEFNYLALSTLIRKALRGEVLVVNSPNTFRTFIDAEQLCNVLLRLAINGFNGKLDSGGHLVNMRELAETISEIIPVKGLRFLSGISSSNYYGNFEQFNKLAFDSGVILKDLKLQVKTTVEAFN